MNNFNNQAFEQLIKDLLNDAFYLEKRSNRGKISTIRQYSEIIIRKILNYSEEEFVTLGHLNIRTELENISNNNSLLLTAIDRIKLIGNKCTHTQEINEITDTEVSEIENNLFCLYSYLFISHFEKYRFGFTREVLMPFSILPPIIRYIVLDYLYQNDKKNLDIIDKLSLATLKAFNRDKALDWLNERKEELKNLKAMDNDAYIDLKSKIGENMAKKIYDEAPNMFDLCYEKINDISKVIENKGLLYWDFESAKGVYLEKGIIKNNTSKEIQLFNNIMEFLYLGRTVEENKRIKNQSSYILI